MVSELLYEGQDGLCHDDIVQWFLSPLTNHRTDAYGGSFDHRRRLLREIADGLRKEIGRPFTFGVLNSTERRIIHTSLQKEEDLFTESVGDGRDRRLQVRLQ